MIFLGVCLASFPVRAEITPGDSLTILIRGVPSSEKTTVEGHYVVGKSGCIKLPLAEAMVRAAGLTGESLARRIEQVYRAEEIYTQPTIEVITKNTDAPSVAQVSIGGQVRRAGPVPYRNGMTLLQAVQAAGDITPFGSRKKVFLTRGKKRWVIDMRSHRGQAVFLEPGDTIEVTQRGLGG